jgi:hypothetical protein
MRDAGSDRDRADMHVAVAGAWSSAAPDRGPETANAKPEVGGLLFDHLVGAGASLSRLRSPCGSAVAIPSPALIKTMLKQLTERVA